MQRVPIDRYIVDVLMRDLVGHDHSSSAFLVYLWLWSRTHGGGKAMFGASLQTIATQTGLSKSAVQNGVRHLNLRQLIATAQLHPTEAPVYQVLQPWLERGSRAASAASHRPAP